MNTSPKKLPTSWSKLVSYLYHLCPPKQNEYHPCNFEYHIHSSIISYLFIHLANTHHAPAGIVVGAVTEKCTWQWVHSSGQGAARGREALALGSGYRAGSQGWVEKNWKIGGDSIQQEKEPAEGKRLEGAGEKEQWQIQLDQEKVGKVWGQGHGTID